MRIGVWGAGSIGEGLVYRLSASPFVSEIVWINRTFSKIENRVIDISHGLSFVPTCRQIDGIPEPEKLSSLPDLDLLVLTQGEPVKKHETRAEKYEANAAILREKAVPVLREGFRGIVLVITNPVDLMARLVYRECSLEPNKVMGLGTVVETARLKSSLAPYLNMNPPARDVWAYAIGTHDEHFIPVARAPLAIGDTTTQKELDAVLVNARSETVAAASRVKSDVRSSLHPIVEGARSVIEAAASDSHAILTISVLAPESGSDQLFYSMPCRVGRDGYHDRNAELLKEEAILDQIEKSCDEMRKVAKIRQA